MALAVVMIYQAIDHLNFAQGEMAMFSTFIAWQLIQWGIPYWLAVGLTLVISFAAGVVIERDVLAYMMRPSWVMWDYTIKRFPSPVGSGRFLGQALMSKHDSGMIGMTLS